YRRMYQGGLVKSSDDSESEGSGSSALDDGDEYLMRSDYSDSTEEKNESRTFTEILASKVTEKRKFLRRKKKNAKESVASSDDERDPLTNLKKRRFLFQKQCVTKSVTSSDDEWHPGTSSKKRK
ncbi:unnamed protein product, partial [Onchocerca ochengi]|uniref:BLVR domain-containing protein n=1 Tax=Onchocerca ochengi TaxID=42157 RepID=A0A182ET00_ONCOC